MTIYNLVGKATDTVSGLSNTFTGTIEVQHGPVITAITATPPNPTAGQAVIFEIIASDPDGSPLDYSLTLEGAPLTPVPGSPNKFSWTAV